MDVLGTGVMKRDEVLAGPGEITSMWGMANNDIPQFGPAGCDTNSGCSQLSSATISIIKSDSL